MRTASSRIGGGPRRLAAVLIALALLPAGATAQGDGRGERPEVDPYTEGDPDAMEEAGYERFGPFAWAGDQTTEVAASVLGGVPILWVETAHFRIGSSLDAYKPEERDEKKKIEAEVKRLKKRIPGLRGKVRELDPWLRLHLWAMRLEELYASFCEEFGFTDDMFPAPPGTVPYVGDGPYLGLKGKFCVLLVEKKSSMARYTGTYCGTPVETTYRFYFPSTQNMFFGMAFESLEGVFHTDSAMHYAVVFNVVQNMANGYRGYTHEAPVWWNTGLARWFARQADPTCLLYTSSKTAGVRFDEKEAEWERKVRARVEQDFFPSMEELMAKTSFDELTFVDHMMIWSRVDHLMTLDTPIKRELITILQEPAAWSAAVSTDASLDNQFTQALPKATGMDAATFDEEWAKYVRRRYEKD